MTDKSQLDEKVSELHALVSSLKPGDRRSSKPILVATRDKRPQPIELSLSTKAPQVSEAAFSLTATPPEARQPKRSPVAVPVNQSTTAQPNGFQRLLSPMGNIGRWAYVKTIVSSLVTLTILIGLQENGHIHAIWSSLGIIATFWVGLVASLKRCRDAGQNPWWLVTLLVPYVQFLTALFLLAAPSKIRP